MGKVNWRQFWERYRKTEIKDERDFFFEVGDGAPTTISEAVFKLSIELVVRHLEFGPNDV